MFTEGRFEVQDAVKYIVPFCKFVLRNLRFQNDVSVCYKHFAEVAAQGLQSSIVAADVAQTSPGEIAKLRFSKRRFLKA